MNDARAPNYEVALLDYQSGMKYKDIAEKYGVTINTVKSWKTRYKWSKDKNKGVHTKIEKVCTQKGGQPGNKNAIGHGGTGPPGNKNAVKTGEFETLFFDVLDQDEKELLDTIQLDKEQLLLQEIQLLTIRERRMLKRIEELKQPIESDPDDKVPEGMSVVQYDYGTQRGEFTSLKTYKDTIERIQSIEDALTRVQARKQKAIEALHRFGFDDARLELETMKFEMAMLKQGDQVEETGDDGFLAAMNASAAEVWGAEDV